MTRTLPTAVVAIAHVALFAICGIFSSKVARVHSSVLLRNGTCGDNTYNSTNIRADAEGSTLTCTAQLAASGYAQQCYAFNESSSSSSLPNCDVYGRNRIDWTITDGVSCPFQDQMCVDDL